jgi:arylsulfatase G
MRVPVSHTHIFLYLSISLCPPPFARTINQICRYVPFSHIHTPQYVATRNIGKSNKTGDAGHFYDTLLEVDETVGTVMSAIKSVQGVDENTLVFLTGDNGPWETKCALSGSAGPYLGLWQKNEGGGGSSSKSTLWEGGHREVGLAWWPGRIAPRVSNALVSTLDYLPTLLNLAGVLVPTDRVYDGIDLAPVLFNGSDQAHTTLFHPNSGSSGVDGKLDGVRWKNFKAIYQTGGAPDCTGSKGNVLTHNPPLLFDLDSDPAEQFALDTTKDPHAAAALTSIVAALAAQMHSVNSTMVSVVNTTTMVSSEPCAHFPTTCRTDAKPAPPTPPPTPPTPPPPPSPPAPPPAPAPGTHCNSSAFYNGTIPWSHQGLHGTLSLRHSP